MQLVFRGEETVRGATQIVTNSFGPDTQRIYTVDNHGICAELQVWIGIPQLGHSECGLYRLPRCLDGSRRCTRFIKVGKQNKGVLKYTMCKYIVFADEPETDPLYSCEQ